MIVLGNLGGTSFDSCSVLEPDSEMGGGGFGDLNGVSNMAMGNRMLHGRSAGLLDVILERDSMEKSWSWQSGTWRAAVWEGRLIVGGFSECYVWVTLEF